MASSVSVFLQPIRDRTKALKGFEALTRCPDITDIESYIIALEQTREIGRHDRHVLDTVCARMADHRDRLGGFFVGVNLSLHTLAEETITQDIKHIIRKRGLRRSDLAFEITETATGLTDQEWVAVYFNLRTLKEAGHVLLLDDFPNGDPERLQYCAHLADIIKLDKAFVAGGGYHGDGFNALRRYFNHTPIVLAEGLQPWQHGTAFHLSKDFSESPLFIQGKMTGNPEPIDLALEKLPITEGSLAARFKEFTQQGRAFFSERRGGVHPGYAGPMMAG